ncbi:hypothetical protein QWZ13_10070 [Reinekea marina]|uniref:hypothetical protein n=1 Tax=Reinekea marina TaxID=1310421 RepID=UPI0025B2C81A|nr:hypothetical protein [Reinekea marina]MDN3649258.1 hypothetical protein [Reinekea marina]
MIGIVHASTPFHRVYRLLAIFMRKPAMLTYIIMFDLVVKIQRPRLYTELSEDFS